VSETGHRELEHTADWALEVWAPDLRELLEEAARGMYDLMGVELEAQTAEAKICFSVDGIDREDLLVTFLSELLFYSEIRHMAFDAFELELDDDDAAPSVSAALEGRPIETLDKEIKAVTYHGLEVREREDGGLSARVTFDV
jgi:SHS2 domain-containing protein